MPIRILLVSPRPEEELRVSYIDHCLSAKPLVDAVESLGELARLTLLTPPTFPAHEEALQKAAAEDDVPFDVVHFDGHGVYDHRVLTGSALARYYDFRTDVRTG